MKNAAIILVVAVIISVVAAVIGLVMGAGASLSGSSAGILKSDNGGASWVVLPEINKSEIETIHFGVDGNMYAGTRRDGLWWIDHTSGKWRQATSLHLGKGVRVFDVVVNYNDIISAVFSDGRGRVTRLSGAMEKELYFTPLAQYAVFGMAKDKKNDNILRIISTDGGFYESLDGGISWRSIYRFNQGLVKIITDKSVSGKYWVVTSNGSIYRTMDAGRTWKNVSAGLSKYPRGSEVESAVWDARAGALYLGTGYGLLRSYDGGDTWKAVPLTVPPEVLPIVAVAVDPKNSNTIFAAAKNQLYVSYDNGESWHGSILATDRVVSVIAIDPENSNNVFIGLRK
jgi:photosystem II stability/assembly factor-like uncharacterized protein